MGRDGGHNYLLPLRTICSAKLPSDALDSAYPLGIHQLFLLHNRIQEEEVT